MEENQIDNDELLGKQQDARAELRERYLRCLIGFSDSSCTMKTVEGTTVSGVFYGMDINGQEMLIKNLQTPIGVMKAARIRTADVHNLSIKNLKNQITPNT